MTGRPTPGQRHAVVTGGGRGIGAAIARALGAAGLAVTVGDLDAGAAEEVAAGVLASGGAATAHPLDVTSTPSYSSFLSRAEQAHGPVDVLVSNAGVMWVGDFAAEPEQAAQRMVEVNLLGVVRGIKLVAPAMRARGSGHLVPVASVASRLAPRGEALYAGTKHAVYGYCSAVRRELHGSGVDVSIVMPSVVTTDLAVGTDAGLVPRLAPDDVARAVVGVVRRPRAEVTLPRRVAALSRAMAVLPPVLRDAVERRVVPDERRVTDVAGRAAYEARALRQPDPGSSTSSAADR